MHNEVPGQEAFSEESRLNWERVSRFPYQEGATVSPQHQYLITHVSGAGEYDVLVSRTKSVGRRSSLVEARALAEGHFAEEKVQDERVRQKAKCPDENNSKRTLSWKEISENPYEERSCGDSFPQYMISDLGLSYLVQVTVDGYRWTKLGSRTNLLDARAFAEAHLVEEPKRTRWLLTTGPNAVTFEYPPHDVTARIIERTKQAGPMEAVAVTHSELSAYNARMAISSADVPDALGATAPSRVTEISPDRFEFTPPHDLATENAELRARLAAARERVIAIQSNLNSRIAQVEEMEAAVAEQRRRVDAFRSAFIEEVAARPKETLNTYLVHCDFGWTEFRVVRAADAAEAYAAWQRACDDEDNAVSDFFSENLQPANRMQITPINALLIRLLEPASPAAPGAYAWCDPEPGAENHAGVARIVAYAERVS